MSKLSASSLLLISVYLLFIETLGCTKQHVRNWEYNKGLKFVSLLLMELSLLGHKDKTYCFRIKVLEEGKEVILSRRNKINKKI